MKYKTRMSSKVFYIGITHLVRTQNLLKYLHSLPTDAHTHLYTYWKNNPIRKAANRNYFAICFSCSEIREYIPVS